jgi:S1-C subfamily serine protease
MNKFMLPVIAAFLLLGLSGQTCRAQTGGVQAEGPRFRLVRSVSGSKGTPQGSRFAMEDPRSVFYVPADHQVIVYMEWDGPVGKHHLEGFWRNPGGKVTVMSDFDYDAKTTRFGAYWTLALTEGAENGNWSLEAHVDGELAGTHSFQIQNSVKPADAEPSRKMLTPAQLYEHALPASVTIEKFDSGGRKFGEASGFLLEPAWIVTAFEGIDGASKVRVTFRDGKRFETEQVAAWNRRQDWAVMKADSAAVPKLQRAQENSWSIGDTASYLETAQEGNRVIANVSIDGKNTFPFAGMRLNISAPPSDRAIGSALLNEYGEVIGIVTASLIPGASALNISGLSVTSTGAVTGSQFRGGLVVPVNSLGSIDANADGTPLSVLVSKGDFLIPVTASQNVAYGQLAKTMDKKGGFSYPTEGGDVFSKKDTTLHIYVLWEGHEKTKGLVTMRLFDIDNRLLNKASLEKPIKFGLGKGEQKSTTWDVPISLLSPGIYRVDVWLDDSPAWRRFFRVLE